MTKPRGREHAIRTKPFIDDINTAEQLREYLSDLIWYSRVPHVEKLKVVLEEAQTFRVDVEGAMILLEMRYPETMAAFKEGERLLEAVVRDVSRKMSAERGED
jgi:hypothetical protein